MCLISICSRAEPFFMENNYKIIIMYLYMMKKNLIRLFYCIVNACTCVVEYLFCSLNFFSFFFVFLRFFCRKDNVLPNQKYVLVVPQIRIKVEKEFFLAWIHKKLQKFYLLSVDETFQNLKNESNNILIRWNL